MVTKEQLGSHRTNILSNLIKLSTGDLIAHMHWNDFYEWNEFYHRNARGVSNAHSNHMHRERRSNGRAWRVEI